MILERAATLGTLSLFFEAAYQYVRDSPSWKAVEDTNVNPDCDVTDSAGPQRVPTGCDSDDESDKKSAHKNGVLKTVQATKSI